jgi:hypothetical protein
MFSLLFCNLLFAEWFLSCIPLLHIILLIHPVRCHSIVILKSFTHSSYFLSLTNATTNIFLHFLLHTGLLECVPESRNAAVSTVVPTPSGVKEHPLLHILPYPPYWETSFFLFLAGKMPLYWIGVLIFIVLTTCEFGQLLLLYCSGLP